MAEVMTAVEKVRAGMRRPAGQRTAGQRAAGQVSAVQGARAAAALLEQAEVGLQQARRAAAVELRFSQAQLAALRAGAAVLATRAQPICAGAAPVRSRPNSVWLLLGRVAPELGEWSEFFAAQAVTRSITTRDADDLLRQAEQFLGLARAAACRNRGHR
ncbi:SAV_6107 family HEPN domain-containing protein [Rhodococcus sp. X156]|uniref:SAV_6107 family HEPN domain-containing protein n=1 Tax=Rhodococcus sp. X156 TaxID=2499145 RepID=UPI000FD8FF2E|nr:SAV_6107 family HEPN domain-containing protein [Rhodococcus sp. X156]